MPATDPTPLYPFLFQLAQENDQIVFLYEVDENRLLYLNPAFREILGLKGEDLSSPQDLLDLMHPEDRAYARERYGQLLAGEFVLKAELRVVLAGKDERWLLIKPMLLEEASGRRILGGTAADITDLKHYADVENKFSHKKNAILEILSHDLAGPLGNIGALANLAASRIKAYKDEHLERVVKLIEQTSAHGIKLIHDFVAQEFLESSEVVLVKGRVNLVQRMQEIVEQYRETQQDASRTYQLFYSDPAIFVEIDDVKFIQVITNLVSNAIKFTHEDGQITIRVEGRERNVWVSVADNGIGIPQKYHASLFDKFTRARRPGLHGQLSTGLGMSLIKLIVEWHKGRIWFESEENQGSTFFIEIPYQ